MPRKSESGLSKRLEETLNDLHSVLLRDFGGKKFSYQIYVDGKPLAVFASEDK